MSNFSIAMDRLEALGTKLDSLGREMDETLQAQVDGACSGVDFPLIAASVHSGFCESVSAISVGTTNYGDAVTTIGAKLKETAEAYRELERQGQIR